MLLAVPAALAAAAAVRNGGVGLGAGATPWISAAEYAADGTITAFNATFTVPAHRGGTRGIGTGTW